MGNALIDADNLPGASVASIGVTGRPRFRHREASGNPVLDVWTAWNAETPTDCHRVGLGLTNRAAALSALLVLAQLDVVVVLVWISISRRGVTLRDDCEGVKGITRRRHSFFEVFESPGVDGGSLSCSYKKG